LLDNVALHTDTISVTVLLLLLLLLLLQAVRPELERQVPTSLLRGVRGLALLSVMRVGAGWSCTAGTGVVMARQRNGTW
jgi:lipid-binding SYLF domain-containing protein